MVFWVEHAIGPIANFVVDALKRMLGIDEEQQARQANTHYIHQLQADLAAERHAREMTDNGFAERERYWRKQFAILSRKAHEQDARCDDMQVTVETSYEIVNAIKTAMSSRFSLVENLINQNSERLKAIENLETLRIHLEPGEWVEIKSRAEENGLTVVQYVRTIFSDLGITK